MGQRNKKKKDKVMNLATKKREHEAPVSEDVKINVTNGELRSLAFVNDANPRGTPYGRLMTEHLLPSKTKFKLKKLFRRVTAALTLFEETRKELIESYAKKDSKGELVLKAPEAADGKPNEKAPRSQWVYDFTKENEEKFKKEFQELLDEKADIDGEKPTFHPDDISADILNVIEMDFLSPLMIFEDED